MTEKNHKLHIDFTFRHTNPSDAVKTRTEEKLSKALNKFLQEDTAVHVVFLVDKHRHIAEITLNYLGHQLVTKAEDEDMYKAVDKAAEVITQQMRKQKEKTVSHHA